MKKIALSLALLSFLILSGCGDTGKQEPPESAGDSIKAYIYDNIGYELSDLRVVEEDTGGYYISAAIGQGYDISEFPAFAEELVQVVSDAEKDFSFSADNVNPSIYTGEDEWIGWSSDQGNLYNQDGYISEGVTLDELGPEMERISEPEIDFGDTLDVFQGEWKDENGRLVISGDTLNFVYESTIGSKSFCDVSTFFFGYDEGDNLVVMNRHSQPRYTISLGEDGALTIKNMIGDEDTRVYEKISDNTEVPEEKVEPAIGMTEAEVYASTWGAPQKVNTTETAAGKREQWVYDVGYIYLDNGIVTAIQER